MSVRHSVAAACVIVSAAVLSGIFSTAATGLAPLQPGTSAAGGADTVICDGELTPSQLRRLESVVQV